MSLLKPFGTLLGLALSTLVISGPANAADAALEAQLRALTERVQQLEQQLATAKQQPAPVAVPVTDPALEQKVRVLERKVEIAAEDAATKAKDLAVVTANDKGFTISSSDAAKTFQLRLKGLVQADARTFLHDDALRADDTFTIAGGGWGAWELVARYGELDVDAFTGGANSFANPTSAASKGSAWGIGANWYLNNVFKFSIDYEYTSFDGSGGGTA